MDVDPLASMRCWAIELELGGRLFEVPPLPAADWWPVLTSGNLTEILDFVPSNPDDPFNLDNLLLSGEVDQEGIAEVLTDAMEAAAGRSLHIAMVLATLAQMHWGSINGALVRNGFRWEGQPLGAALDAVYAEVVGRLDKDGLAKFTTLLNTPMKGRKGQVPEKIVSEFESLAGPRPTSGVKSSGEPSDNARPRTRTRPRPPRQDDPSSGPRRPRGRPAGSGPAASS